jgi:hypothetical protein
MNWIKKLIPAYIEIRSLYWVERGKDMDAALKDIFHQIDMDNLDEAIELIKKFESTFTQGGVPHWIGIKYAEIYRAISMVHFLKAPLQD